MANVLITSSSSKVLLVKSFADAVSKYNGNVFTGDITGDVATAFVSDKHFILPKTSNRKAFVDCLMKICNVNNINIIIPTRDGELPIMSDIKQEFGKMGVKILVPNKKTVDLCLNKKMFSEFLETMGLQAVPVVSDIGTISPPYFIRPVYGAASIGVKSVDTHAEVKLYMNDDFLVHPFIDSDEFSIDLLMNIDGSRALQAVCRHREHIVGGESKISKVVDIPILEKACLGVGERLGLVGHNVLQAFYSENLGVVMIEANARFGGASNLSIKAGLNSPDRIIKMYVGDDSAYTNNNIKFGLSMYRYSEDIIV